MVWTSLPCYAYTVEESAQRILTLTMMDWMPVLSSSIILYLHCTDHSGHKPHVAVHHLTCGSQVEMCCKGKLHSGFGRMSMRKNIKYLIFKIVIAC